MKNVVRNSVIAVMIALLGLVSPGAAKVTAPEASPDTPRGQSPYHNFVTAVEGQISRAPKFELVTRASGADPRDDLRPIGPGYVVAADYGTDQADLAKADGVATAAGKALVIGRKYEIDTTRGNFTLSSAIIPVKGGMLTRTGSGTNHLIITALGQDPGLFPWISDNSPNHDWAVFNAGAGKEYYPEWFGAAGDAATDDSAAFASCWAAITTGKMRLLSKAYKTSGSLVPKSNCGIVGDGIGATRIDYSGAGIWLKVPASISTPNFTWQGMTVTCSGAALGVLQHQTTSQAYGAANFSENWKIADIQCVGSNTAGSVGLSLTQLGNSFLSNIKVHEFATNILCDRTTDNTYIKIRTITSSMLPDSIGWEWRAADTISVGGALQEYAYGVDVELLATGSVGIKVDAANIHINDVFYEKSLTTSKGKCFLWLTENCVGTLAHNGARYALGNGTLDNLILVDDSTSIYQRGTFADNVVFGSPAVTVSFGSSGTDWPWQFIAPNETLYNLLKPAIAAKKVAIAGGRMNSILRTPGACGNVATPISIRDTTPTMVGFDGAAWDNDRMINVAGVHPTRVAIVTPGIYAISANVLFSANARGVRYLRVFRRGTDYIAGIELPAGTVSGTLLSVSAIRELEAGDYLQLEVYQSSGGALDLNSARLAVQRLSSAQ
jgi:hypothetical protein